MLTAPFPWFGGKRRVAHLVWPRFGDVPNYVEPFAGSLAVLLARPHAPRCETVNDLDCYVANFWRAMQAAPDEVAAHADWPVNEADLHARHRWLVDRVAFRDALRSNPEHFDVKVAGWWVWGISQWIGQGWCSDATGKRLDQKRIQLGRGGRGSHGGQSAGWRQRPDVSTAGRGILSQQIPSIGRGGESGPQARPMHPAWAQALRDECQAAGVPFLFKQWGEWAPGVATDGQGAHGAFDLAGRFDQVEPEAACYVDNCGEGEQAMYRPGKHAAGRLLDGRTWDDVPIPAGQTP